MAQQMAQQMAVGQTAEELEKLDQAACPVCGITFYEFRSQGRLGCQERLERLRQMWRDRPPASLVILKSAGMVLRTEIPGPTPCFI